MKSIVRLLSVFVLLSLLSPSARADFVMGYSTSATSYTPPPSVNGIPTFTVNLNGSVPVHLFIVQQNNSGLADNGDVVDLTDPSEALNSGGVALNYAPSPTSATITNAAPIAPFSLLPPMAFDPVAGSGMVIAGVAVGTSPPTGMEVPVATFTFNAGVLGNITTIASAKPNDPNQIFTDIFTTVNTTTYHVLDMDAFSPTATANIVTAVPEPSSFALLVLVATLGYAGVTIPRLWRQSGA